MLRALYNPSLCASWNTPRCARPGQLFWLKPDMSYRLSFFTTGWTKAAQQKARSEQQESAQASNKRARIEFSSSATSVPQRGSGMRSDVNNPYLQHHARPVPTAPPRKSRFGAQYGVGGIEHISRGGGSGEMF